jgi:hypothetical protein
MKKNGVFVTILIILALVAAISVFVERRHLITRFTSAQKTTKQLYYCPMHPTFTSDKPGNCAICGMSLVRKESASASAPEQKSAGGDSKKILFYRNPMNPQVTSPVPMKDQMGMDYIPVYEKETAQAHPGVYINPAKQQLIGVKKEKVQKRKLAGQIMTVGRVAYDPALFIAQEEYIQALKSRQAVQKLDPNYANEQAALLIKAARYKLLLLGMSDAEIDELEKRGKAQNNLYLPSSEDKNIWVYITIYEYEAGFVKEGLPVEIETLAYPGQTFHGRVVSVAPILEAATRTLKARALVDNTDNKLKPEMFVNVKIDYDLGEKLAVPEDAVMHAGTRDIVFATDPNGYFESKVVTLGAKGQGYYEVLQGLAVNEEVVTSGNFLIDSESKLNAVLNQMAGPNQEGSDHP